MTTKITISDDTKRLIQHCHRGGTWGYFHVVDQQGRRESRWWRDGNIPDQQYLRDDGNLFWGIHPTFEIPPTNADGVPTLPKYVRSQKYCIQAVNTLYSDHDAKQPMFNGDIGAVVKHIDKLPVQPSVQIVSGNGVHSYWFLRDPFIITNEDQRTAIDTIQQLWVDMVKGDGVKDLTRVLRVPDSFNTKYSPPALVFMFVRDFDRTYTLEDLARCIPPVNVAPPRKSTVIPYQPRTGSATPIDDFNASHRVTDLLEQRGYAWRGRRMIAPNSSSKTPGIIVHEDTNKIWTNHGSDPLNLGHPISPFDVIQQLDYNGDFHAALAAIKRGAL